MCETIRCCMALSFSSGALDASMTIEVLVACGCLLYIKRTDGEAWSTDTEEESFAMGALDKGMQREIGPSP